MSLGFAALRCRLLHCWASLRSAPTYKSIPAQKSPAPARRARFRNTRSMVVVAVIVIAVIVIAVTVIAVTVIAVVMMPAVVPAIVVATAPVRVMTPIGALHLPAVAVMHPVRPVIDVAGAGALPHAADPHVAAAAPVPVARRPDVTRTRRGHHFVTRRRWWRTDAQAETHLRGRRWRESCGGAPCNGERGKQCEFACLHNAPPWSAGIRLSLRG